MGEKLKKEAEVQSLNDIPINIGMSDAVGLEEQRSNSITEMNIDTIQALKNMIKNEIAMADDDVDEPNPQRQSEIEEPDINMGIIELITNDDGKLEYRCKECGRDLPHRYAARVHSF